MAQVSVQGLNKSFGVVEVLRDVTIGIDDGQFVVLVGPSGCGKSTMLRMIAGLESVTSGRVTIGDTIVNDLLPKQRDIAMVFQSYALYPHKTVAQNMGFALKLAKVNRAEIDSRVHAAADILGLTNLLNRRPRQLSGGQRQRVAMGRAIVRDPQVFLFDEPLSNLDAKLRVKMRAEIKELHQRLKTTTIYVTHDQIEAMTMADKIVVMNAGEVEQVGTPLELYDQPKNMFVAGFLGSPAMNFLNGTVVSGSSVSVAGFELMHGNANRSDPGLGIICGIRPEHLELADEGIPATVSVVEPTGSETHVFLKHADGELTAVLRDRHTLHPGQNICVRPRLDQVHLFDRQTEMRL